MKFKNKIFFCTFFVAFFSCTLLITFVYYVSKKDIQNEFVNRYIINGMLVGNLFHQLELTSDLLNHNAGLFLSLLIEKNKQIPSDRELAKLAENLGVKAFYVINQNGKFIRSSDLPIKFQVNSLFSYSKEYKKLTEGTLRSAATPIIPSFPHDIPAKFAMMPSKNHSLILESSIHLKYINTILNNVVSRDKDIISIGLFSPNGYKLGAITNNGNFKQGERGVSNKILAETKIEGDVLSVCTLIPASVTNCPECIQKQSSLDAKYYYYLITKISLIPLKNRLNVLRNELLLVLLIMIISSAVISKWIAKNLVRRLEHISHTTNEIIESKNLDLEVKDNLLYKDEISGLAISFNTMIKELKIYQSQLIDQEKNKAISDIATKVAHDIRSPLAALDMTISSLAKKVNAVELSIQREAIKSINKIADDLLNKHKQMKSKYQKIITHEANVDCSILLYPIICQVITLKEQEWENNPCMIHLVMQIECKLIWLHANTYKLSRMFSNLLNNAYEAVKGDRNIYIEVINVGNYLLVSIKDNGHGIASENIPYILSGTTTKNNGNGLGLSSAKQIMSSLGGKLEIQSKINVGTTISLYFPIKSKPKWFENNIKVFRDYIGVIVDDDFSIHAFAKEKFNHLNCETKHFQSSEKFFEWYNNHKNSKFVFLIDYDLGEGEPTGLDIIKNIDKHHPTYLITSCYDEPFIQSMIDKVQAYLMPKFMYDHIILADD